MMRVADSVDPLTTLGHSVTQEIGCQDRPRIALFIPSLAGGGVARVILDLADAFVRRGHQVDLLLGQVAGPYVDQVPPHVTVVGLAQSPGLGRVYALLANGKALRSLLRPILLPQQAPQVVQHLPSLVRYLRRGQPAVLFAAKTHTNLVALWARRLAKVRTRVVISERINLSQAVQGKERKWRWRFIAPVVRHVYPWADGIIAVSNGVADDLSLFADIPRERITTVYNPVVTPELLAKAKAPLDHPWFQPGAPPVLLGVGRLTAQKDFSTLLRAFARVRSRREVRLMILGEGRHAEQRSELLALADSLGVAADVALPGFVDNPFAYMTRAAVFVLSSTREGLPGVLTQALACGCPVVSTDCPSGPAEILENGKYGPLVPVGDNEALANAILSVLDTPSDRERLRARAAMFSADRAVGQYLEVLFAKKE
jgi:glycosyltransferase involved in cell wall biosynthesis